MFSPNEKGEDMQRERTIHERWNLCEIDWDDAFGEGEAPLWHDVPVQNLTPHELGELGEYLAGLFLVRNGYELIQHSYRCPEGEADYVAYDQIEECIVLVEVKTRRARERSGDAYPEEAVDARKQRRYRRIAASYQMDNFPVPSLRFDTVGITVYRQNAIEIEQACGAFDWECEQ